MKPPSVISPSLTGRFHKQQGTATPPRHPKTLPNNPHQHHYKNKATLAITPSKTHKNGISLTAFQEALEQAHSKEHQDEDTKQSSSATKDLFRQHLGLVDRCEPRWRLHDSILETIGETPIVQLKRMAPSHCKVYVKCEQLNPGGSLKDRLARGVIEWAELTGVLQPGQTVVEASSGNTGIGLAMVCAAKGYPFICVMSETYSVERRKIMRYLGAKVVLTKKEHKATGMVMKAQELADAHGYFYPKQFENEANAWIHEITTGQEIFRAFQAQNKVLDDFFMSYGTGGTVLGIGRALRHHSPGTRIHLCEPTNAPMVQSGIPTQYPSSGFPSTSFAEAHPVWNPHILQGWATDFIPQLASTAHREHIYDAIHSVSGNEAVCTSQRLAREEGILVGISGGGVLSAALTYARTAAPAESNLLVVLADTGERYMSTELFESIDAEMSAEEQALYDSTPNRPPPAPPIMHGMLPKNTDELFDI